jgi:hypothetical protein
MKPASENQIIFASKIAWVLDIDMPKEKTAQAYFLFIQEHIEEYQIKKKEQDEARRKYLLRHPKPKTKSKDYKRGELDEMHEGDWITAMDFGWM